MGQGELYKIDTFEAKCLSVRNVIWFPISWGELLVIDEQMPQHRDKYELKPRPLTPNPGPFLLNHIASFQKEGRQSPSHPCFTDVEPCGWRGSSDQTEDTWISSSKPYSSLHASCAPCQSGMTTKRSTAPSLSVVSLKSLWKWISTEPRIRSKFWKTESLSASLYL